MSGTDPRANHDALQTIVARVLHADQRESEAHEAEIVRLEQEGFRVVSGGQVGPDTWEVRDYRTNTILLEGTGGWDEYGTAVDGHDSSEQWIDEEHIRVNSPDPVDEEIARIVESGVPSGLVEMIAEWALNARDEVVEAYLQSAPR